MRAGLVRILEPKERMRLNSLCEQAVSLVPLDRADALNEMTDLAVRHSHLERKVMKILACYKNDPSLLVQRAATENLNDLIEIVDEVGS